MRKVHHLMKKLILIAMIIGLSCQARIGETEEQCNERYGKVTIKKGKYLYNKKGFTISIEFIDGICQQIAYWKINWKTFRYEKLSITQIKILLNLNSKEWILMADDIWKTKDLTAFYINKTLLISTKLADEKYLKDQKDKDQKALEGL